MLTNNKFNNLVQNIFCNITSRVLNESLDKLYSKNIHKITNFPKIKGCKQTRMQKLFCDNYTLKNIVVNDTKVANSNKSLKTSVCDVSNSDKVKYRKTDSPVILKKPKQSENVPKVTESIREEISLNAQNIHNIDILDKFTNKNNKYYIKSIVKKDDFLSICVFTAVSNIFNISPDTYKKQLLKDVKTDIIAKFNKEDYYKNYDYSIKHFKKSDAEEIFINNRPITLNMLKIYGDILDINIVYIDNKVINYITKFNKLSATIVIEDHINRVHLLCSKDKYIRGLECVDILNINKTFTTDSLSKLSLDNLQNIAKMKNLNIKKAGKTGKINIKKPELIELITNN